MDKNILKNAAIRGLGAYVAQSFIAPQLNRVSTDPKIQGAILAAIGVYIESSQKNDMIKQAGIGLQVSGVAQIIGSVAPQGNSVQIAGVEYEGEYIGEIDGFDDEIGELYQELGAAESRNLFDDVAGIGNLPNYFEEVSGFENDEISGMEENLFDEVASMRTRLEGLGEVLEEINGLGDIDGTADIDEFIGATAEMLDQIEGNIGSVDDDQLMGMIGEISEALEAIENELYGVDEDIDGVDEDIDGVDEEMSGFEF